MTDYPFMQGWKQYRVLEANEVLAAIPEQERPKVAALVGQRGIPAENAIAIIRNLAAMKTPERARIFDLAESSDSRDRSAALTEAAKVPPMPDPRLAVLDDAKRLVRKAARMFPGDPANDAIAAILPPFEAAYAAVKEHARDGRNGNVLC